MTATIQSHNSFDTIGGFVSNKKIIYGKDALNDIWNVEILDQVPEVPAFDWNKIDPFFGQAYRENYLLFYKPGRVRKYHKELNFSLNALEKVSGIKFSHCGAALRKQFGNDCSSGTWLLASKKNNPKYAAYGFFW